MQSVNDESGYVQMRPNPEPSSLQPQTAGAPQGMYLSVNKMDFVNTFFHPLNLFIHLLNCLFIY